MSSEFLIFLHEFLEFDRFYVVFNDPRRFGMFFKLNNKELISFFSNYGLDLLVDKINISEISNKFKKKSVSLKQVLLDQTIFVGIGNIYANEALFVAGISPRRKAGSIAGVRAERLATAILTTLRAAIDDGGTSLRDHVQPGGEIGYFAQRLSVYGKTGEGCPKCNALIKTIIQSGRSSF